MITKNYPALLMILFVVITGQILTSCSTSQPYYFGKGTGFFNDPYKTNSKTNPAKTGKDLTANSSSGITASDLSSLIQDELPQSQVSNQTTSTTQRIVIHKPTRKELKQLKKRLAMVLDTTKKRERVTIQTNEKKVDELRNEVDNLKNSVKAEKEGDKVVVSFEKPQTGLSKEAKILIIVVAALLLIGLLSLPIIGPVLGIVLGIAVVAAALALVLGVIEIS